MISNTKKRILGTLLFVAIAAALAFACSILLKPTGITDTIKSGSTVRGLYAQEKDSVNVLFLGTSSVLAGVAPARLYEHDGIVSYNCATRAQPLIASLYLLKEAHRLNPNNLKTVVIDPISAVWTEATSAMAREPIQALDASPLKMEAMVDCSRFYEDYNLLENLIPIFGYHSRWNKLSSDDYEYLVRGDSSLDLSSHGYYARYGTSILNGGKSDWKVDDAITDDLDSVTRLEEASYNAEVSYLDRIADYCATNDIELIFAKMPRTPWDDIAHDSIQLLANEYGIEFYDFNQQDIAQACGFDYGYDFVDHRHANVRGAQKITDYLGGVLKRDHRQTQADSHADSNDGSRAFSNADLDAYHRQLKDARLSKCNALLDYLDLVAGDGYAVFIATQGSCSEFSPEIRERLKALSLNTLADIQPGYGYVGFMNDGQALRGTMTPIDEENVYCGSFDGREFTIGYRTMQPDARVPDVFYLVSGPKTSIYIQKTEYCIKQNGINIVVFDTKTGEVIDSCCFSPKTRYKRVPMRFSAAGVDE